ncbi:MAG: peptidylprolyl isomerase [Ferruginibacter sp.]|nr:peptidylprolyl isomerase [Ferruginibacter sp.]
MKSILLGLCLISLSFSSKAQDSESTKPYGGENAKVVIQTDMGEIIVQLYNETPLHKENFLKLVEKGFYDSLLFHRIIPEFMIQGGDPLSKNAAKGSALGMGGGDMARIPAEFNELLIHKRGALAAARDNNPEKASSACQFYLVQGKQVTDEELDQLELQQGRKYTEEQRKIYKEIGGTPFLDMNYTVFGEVEKGLDVIDKILEAKRDNNNRPLQDIRMKISVFK